MEHNALDSVFGEFISQVENEVDAILMHTATSSSNNKN